MSTPVVLSFFALSFVSLLGICDDFCCDECCGDPIEPVVCVISKFLCPEGRERIHSASFSSIPAFICGIVASVLGHEVSNLLVRVNALRLSGDVANRSIFQWNIIQVIKV